MYYPAKFNFTNEAKLRVGRSFEWLLSLPTSMGTLTSYDFAMTAKHKELDSLITFTCYYDGSTRNLEVSSPINQLVTIGNYLYDLKMTDLSSIETQLLEGELQLVNTVTP